MSLFDDIFGVVSPLLGYIEEYWYWIVGVLCLAFFYFIINGLRWW